jgi:hypothetical protein
MKEVDAVDCGREMRSCVDEREFSFEEEFV